MKPTSYKDNVSKGITLPPHKPKKTQPIAAPAPKPKKKYDNSLDYLINVDKNCGIGKGGFQAGNDCASGYGSGVDLQHRERLISGVQSILKIKKEKVGYGQNEQTNHIVSVKDKEVARIVEGKAMIKGGGTEKSIRLFMKDKEVGGGYRSLADAKRMIATVRVDKSLAKKTSTNNSDTNCGIGKGGFQPGNTCAGGDGGEDTLPEGFVKLKQDHSKYFTKEVAEAATYKEIKLSDMTPIRAREKGIANANKYMKQAYDGEGQPREPISVVRGDNGKYTIMDGNSTYANAKHSGWKTMPVQVFKSEADAHAHEAAKKAAKEAKKMTGNSSINCGIGKGGFQKGNTCAKGSPTVPGEERLRSESLFPNVERVRDMAKPTQPCNPPCDEDTVFAMSEKASRGFAEALNHGKGVDKAIGGIAVVPDSVEEFLGALDMPGPLIIIAPLKGKKRAREKVELDYGGDWSKLTDVVRATVAVETKDDIPTAISAANRKLEEQGFKLALLKNRMENPLDSGYRDLNTLWKNKDGVVVELQFNTKSLIKAKETVGHVFYEQERQIRGKAASEGRDLTKSESDAIDRLQVEMQRVYNEAWSRT